MDMRLDYEDNGWNFMDCTIEELREARCSSLLSRNSYLREQFCRTDGQCGDACDFEYEE